MKITVIGGTGLIGSRVVALLEEHGHDATPASPATGTDTLTGEGVDDALAGAEVVVDVSNSPSFADDDVMHFFVTSSTNLLAAARRASVRHYVALSVVGNDRLLASGYLRAKAAQERLITESGIPFTIVRATQFYEFLRAIAEEATTDGVARLSTAHFQPMASDDVAAAVARTAAGDPSEGVREIGGPDRVRMSDLIETALRLAGDDREVVADPDARYFGTTLEDDSLVPGPGAELSTVGYRDWAERQVRT
ncbi:uncharacterized protein YbjT (DUF2867 family) [Mumia flava]|uniref:Uncharacterized protein YbjT (DUF2867 family) n=1 Tax=Mumia flava TaxID=1348852 RepID=A0A0B2BH50_9ACTN|nr:SDR family oxidoreductase [Mumia flava]PJJ54222.1 uncharacterized protein YbjT (DUF2867 family) [Mumia flava]